MTQEELVDEYFAVSYPEPPPKAENTWRELRPWHSLDQALRDAGCRIEHRPKNREAFWSHRDWGKQTESDMAKLCGLDKERPKLTLKGGLGK